MEFYLIRDKPVDIVTPRMGGSLKMSGALEVLPESVVQNSGNADDYCQYLINSLIENPIAWKDNLGAQSKISPYLRLFLVFDATTSPDKQIGSIRISHGRDDAAGGDSILQRLAHVHGEDKVTVNVQLAGLNYDGSNKYDFDGKDLKIKLVSTDDKERAGCEFITEGFPQLWRSSWPSLRFRGELTVSVNFNHKGVSRLHLENHYKWGLLDTNEVLLNDAVFTDFVIIASNGAEVQCHRANLAACSDVFMAMFHSKMKEDSTNSMDMDDMSEGGVRAFLAYIYYWDLEAASESCDVACELYRAGEKYNMSNLEHAMLTLICAKKNEWFNVDAAIKLLLFAIKLIKHEEGKAEKIIGKTMSFLRWCAEKFPDQIRNSEEYKRLFKANPEVAMEIGILFLKI